MRRIVKKHGLFPSFGDLVLPVVSVAAVGLLILAGRQFFINGLQKSPQITSTRAYADSPALIAEREQEALIDNVLESGDEDIVIADIDELDDIVEEQPQITPPIIAQSTTTTTTKKSAPVPINKQWRVQIGAYGTKQAANEAAKKVRQAGYRAVVYQNPASKHVKVWVEGGPTKFYADRIADEMKKLGFKSSFSFPPAK